MTYFFITIFPSYLAFAATTVAVVLWIIFGVLTFRQIERGSIFPGKSELVACLFPVVAYCLGMKLLYELDHLGNCTKVSEVKNNIY